MQNLFENCHDTLWQWVPCFIVCVNCTMFLLKSNMTKTYLMNSFLNFMWLSLHITLQLFFIRASENLWKLAIGSMFYCLCILYTMLLLKSCMTKTYLMSSFWNFMWLQEFTVTSRNFTAFPHLSISLSASIVTSWFVCHFVGLFKTFWHILFTSHNFTAFLHPSLSLSASIISSWLLVYHVLTLWQYQHHSCKLPIFWFHKVTPKLDFISHHFTTCLHPSLSLSASIVVSWLVCPVVDTLHRYE